MDDPFGPAKHCEAPWTDDQVASLNGYQKCRYVHPFTGDRPDDGGERPDLIATREGWVEYEGGPIYQRWAHDFMANWAWKSMVPDWLPQD